MPVFNEGVGSVGSAKARGTVSLEVDSKVTHKETVRCGKSSRCPNGVLPCSAEEYVHECRRVFCECVTICELEQVCGSTKGGFLARGVTHYAILTRHPPLFTILFDDTYICN